MKLFLRWSFWASLFLFIFLAPPAQTRADAPKRCVVMVINCLTLSDMAGGKMERLAKNSSRFGVGLLNLRTNGGYCPEKILLGISAGAPVQADVAGDLFLQGDETYNKTPARELYARLFGGPPACSVFNPFYASLSRQNINAEFVNEIGYLGDALHLNGGKTGLWGGEDPEVQTPSRAAGLIAADSRGRIDNGTVNRSITVPDPFFPSGQRLDEEKLWQVFLSRAGETDLAVIDWGELQILDYWAPYLPALRYHSLRRESILRLDRFIARLYRYCAASRRALVLLSAATPRDPLLRERQGWAMIYNQDWKRGGLLISSTTHNPGLVTPYDLHRFLAAALGIPAPASAIGAPIRVVPGNLPGLSLFNDQQNDLELQRTPILVTLIYLFSVLLLVGGATALLSATPNLPSRLLRHLLPWATLLPLTFLLAPLLKPRNLFLHLLSGLILAVILLFLIQRIVPAAAGRLETICWLTTAVLLADALRGGFFSRWSVLGYSLASGARYYGLGNEYTGVLAGTVLLAAGLRLHQASDRKKALRLIGPVFLLVPAVVGFPRFGANFGDIVPMIPVIGITWTLLSDRRPNPRNVLVFSLALLIVLSLFALYDRRQANPTHLGRLVQGIQSNGWRAAGLLIQRKLEMNWKLVQYSRWTILVLLVLIIFPLALYSPRGPLRRVFLAYPSLRAAYTGVSLAAIGGFVFNDSGIVTAATTLLIPSLSLLALMIEENLTEAAPVKSTATESGPF